MNTIFVLDDDPILTEAMADALSGPTTEVRIFSDPIQALATLSSSRADLLITDLSMPWVDGRDVVVSARLRQPDLKILLMSGYRRGATIAATEHVQFLQKPIDLEGLLSAVAAALLEAAPSNTAERSKRETPAYQAI